MPTNTIDLVIWKQIVPRIKPDLFKSRLIRLIALTYISLYRMPREFLFHYLKGSGSTITVETKGLIIENPNLAKTILSHLKSCESGILKVSQLELLKPGWKYSVGSFYLRYLKKLSNEVNLTFYTTYNYKKNTGRLTKHLHSSLYSLKEKKNARSFDVRGSNITIKTNELMAIANNCTPGNEQQKKIYVLV